MKPKKAQLKNIPTSAKLCNGTQSGKQILITTAIHNSNKLTIYERVEPVFQLNEKTPKLYNVNNLFVFIFQSTVSAFEQIQIEIYKPIRVAVAGHEWISLHVRLVKESRSNVWFRWLCGVTGHIRLLFRTWDISWGHPTPAQLPVITSVMWIVIYMAVSARASYFVTATRLFVSMP